MFSASPIKRIGVARFLRNVLIAIGNSGDKALVPVVRDRLGDASPLVRGAAVWALSRIASNEAVAMAGDALAREEDEGVREEWRAAMTICAAA